MNARTPAGVLGESRRLDSARKRQRVRQAIDEMLRSGDPVTFAAVARAARVSTWLVYADGVREHVEQAMKRQAAQPAASQRSGLTPSAASLRTDLELARTQIRDLRAERDKLRNHIRLQLGHQLDQIHSKTLIDRIDELTTCNQRLADQHHQIAAGNQQLRQRITELEDDLTAARTSLRRMIRTGNLAASDGAVPAMKPGP